jgi:hypothetical protein
MLLAEKGAQYDQVSEVFGVKGFTPWWERMQALPIYESTAPQLG